MSKTKKTKITVTITPVLVDYLEKSAPNNRSKFIEDLLKEQMKKEYDVKIVDKLMSDLANNDRFISAIAKQVGKYQDKEINQTLESAPEILQSTLEEQAETMGLLYDSSINKMWSDEFQQYLPYTMERGKLVVKGVNA